MLFSILALVALIVVTPFLLGRPNPEVTAQPVLIIGMNKNESSFIVTLRAAADGYQYDLLRLTINGSNPSANWTFNETHNETEVYDLHRWVPGNATFSVNAYVVDRQQNYFEYNVTTRGEKDGNGHAVMVFTFPFEPDRQDEEVRRMPSEEDFRRGDFRLAFPRRGTLS
jgi:hypothetical protein